MSQPVAHALLWLLVINLGTVFGAGIYEARVVVPLWASAPPESLRSPDSGRRFWAFVTTVPLTLLALGNLLAAWQAPATQRAWWLAAVALILVERALTFGYFIPTMLRLQRSTTLPEPAIRGKLSQWARFNYFRSALTLAAWLAALIVLASVRR